MTNSTTNNTQAPLPFMGLLNALTGDRSQRVMKLIITSFRLLGGQELRSLIISRIQFSVACHVIFLLALTSIVYQYHAGIGGWVMAAMILIIWPYSFFFHVNQRACQSYLGYAKVTHHKAGVVDAERVASGHRGALRLFAIVEIILAQANASEGNNQSNGGILRVLVAAALMALDGLYEVAESYLLPAIMIEQLSLKQAADKLRDLKTKVPEALAGTFGVDVIGGVTSSILALPFFILGLLAFACAYFLPKVAPSLPTITMHSQGHADIHVFIFPVLLVAVLIFMFARILKIFTTSVRAVYFGIFYTALNKPNEIPVDMQDKVTSYLKS